MTDWNRMLTARQEHQDSNPGHQLSTLRSLDGLALAMGCDTCGWCITRTGDERLANHWARSVSKTQR